MNLYKIKEILMDNGYYCTCLYVNEVNCIFDECVSLIKGNKKDMHYVVVKKISSKYVYFYDPLFVQIRIMKIDKFRERWSNICLVYTKV